jgi:hypothetical protein
VSRADQQLIAALQARNLKVSPYQLERWRRLGLIPPNVRRSLGRGRGTTSELAPDAVACAATVAAAVGSNPDSILRTAAVTLTGDWPHPQDIAARPLRLSLRSLIRESDLVDIDEDTAYEQAAYASSPQFSNFSPQRHHPSLRDVSNVVAHKRQVHEHYLVASYLGVDVVAQRLLRQSVLEVGFANDDEADLLIALLQRSFTRASERIAILDEVDLEDLAYLLHAATLAVGWIRSDHWWSSAPPATSQQIERLEAVPLGFVKKLREPSLQLAIAITIALATDEEFQHKVVHALGANWSQETRSRIHATDFGIRIDSLSAARQSERMRQWDQWCERSRETDPLFFPPYNYYTFKWYRTHLAGT